MSDNRPTCKASRVVLSHDATNGGAGYFHTAPSFQGYKGAATKWLEQDRGLFNRHIFHRPYGSKEPTYAFAANWDACLDPEANRLFADFPAELVAYLSQGPEKQVEVYTGRPLAPLSLVVRDFEIRRWGAIASRFPKQFRWVWDAGGGLDGGGDSATAYLAAYCDAEGIAHGVEPVPKPSHHHWQGERVVQLDRMLRKQIEDRWRGWMPAHQLGPILTCFTGHDSDNSLEDDICFCIDKVLPLGDQFDIGIPSWQVDRWMEQIRFI